MGMLKDKDISHSIDFIKGKFQTVITLTVDNPRTLTGEELAHICRDKFPNVITADSPKNAVDIALDLAKKEDCTVMICGSLYLAGEIRPIILERLSE